MAKKRKTMLKRILSAMLAVMLVAYNIPFGMLLHAVAETTDYPGEFTVEIVNNGVPVGNQEVFAENGNLFLSDITDTQGIANFPEISTTSFGGDNTFYFYFDEFTVEPSFEILLEEGTTAHYRYDMATDQVTVNVAVNQVGSGNVSFNIDGQDFTGPLQIEKGKDVTVTITPDTNYEISSVQFVKEGITETKTVSDPRLYTETISSISDNTLIEVEFVTTVSTITVNQTGLGTVNINDNAYVEPVQVNKNSNVDINIIPDTNYVIKSLKIGDNQKEITDANNQGYQETITASSDTTILVEFAIKTYTVTFNSSGNGTLEDGDGQTISSSAGTVDVEHGSNSSFTATPNEGYHIKSIVIDETNKIDLSSLAEGEAYTYTFTTITENHNVAVEFAINTYQVTSTVNGGNGTVSPDLTKVEYNGETNITITPNESYRVKSVKVDDVENVKNIVENPDLSFNLPIKEVKDPKNVVVEFESVPILVEETWTNYVDVTPISGSLINKLEGTNTFVYSSDAQVSVKPVTPYKKVGLYNASDNSFEGWKNEYLIGENTSFSRLQVREGNKMEEIKLEDNLSFVFDTVSPEVGEPTVQGEDEVTIGDSTWYSGQVNVSVNIDNVKQTLDGEKYIPETNEGEQNPEPVTYASEIDKVYYSPGTYSIESRQVATYDSISGSYTFPTVDEDFSGIYSIVAVDKAGNESLVKTVNINIDKTIPDLPKEKTSVSFEQINDSSFAQTLNFLTFGTFFNKKIEVTVKVKDEASGIKEIKLNTDIPDVVPQLIEGSFLKNGLSAEAKFTLDVENLVGTPAGTFNVDVWDMVNNTQNYLVTTVNSNIAADNSGIVMIEKNLPTAEITITEEAQADEDKYNENVTFNVTAADTDSGLNSISIDVNGTKYPYDYSNLTEKQTTAGPYTINTSGIAANLDGSYIITVDVIDNAGNEISESKTVFIDKSNPYILGYVFSTEGSDGIYHDLVEENSFTENVELTEYGYYFKKNTRVTVKTQDSEVENELTSGVKSIIVYLKDINGIYYSVLADGSLQEIVESDINAIVPVPATSELTFDIPASFKGQIFAKATDRVNNTSAFETSMGAIIESEEQHLKETHIAFEKAATSLKDNNNLDLYSENVDVNLTVTDTYSGIQKIEWSVVSPYDTEKNQNGSLTINNDKTYSADSATEGWSQTQSELNLVTEMKKTLTVSNNSNNIAVKVKVTDRAGNTSEEEIHFSIDKTKPTIDISYDNNTADIDNTYYYNSDRTSTIVVTERNFKPEDVNYLITSTDGVIPTLVGWTTVENTDNPDLTTHTAIVHYAVDGDYTFNIDYRDNAENSAPTTAQHTFTIDKTKPEIDVSYDNHEVYNGNYYKAIRTGTITITEHNFDPSRIQIPGTATIGTDTFPALSTWTTNGDVHTATIVYSDDALYTFDIDFKDMAGNTSDNYGGDEFYVDKTVPTLAEGKAGATFVQTNTNYFARVLNFLSFGTFFNKEIEVTVKVKDNVAGIEEISMFTSDNQIVPQQVKDTFKVDGLTAEAKFTVDAESFLGTFNVKVTDKSMNEANYLLTSSNSNISSLTNEMVMFDKVEPTAVINVIPKDGVSSNGSNAYNGEVTYEVTVGDADSGVNTVVINVNGKEYKYDYSELTEKQVNLDPFMISTDDEGISIHEDGSYDVSLYVIDNAGNVNTAEITTYKDETNPVVTDYIFSTKNNSGSYEGIEDTEDLSDSVELTDYGFYFKKQTQVTVKADDPEVNNEFTSEVKSITAYLKDYNNGKYYAVLANGKLKEITESEIKSITPVPATSQISFEVPKAFKGQIFAKATDHVENTGAFKTPDGTIVEDVEQHAKETHIELEKAPTTTKDNNNVDLYAGNVDVGLTVTDTYSGLSKIEWSVVAPYDTENNQSGSITINNDKTYVAGSNTEGWSQTKTEKNIVLEMTKTLTVKNNSNDIVVKVKMTDRAGHTSEEEMKFSIDKTDPAISVTYDNNSADIDNADFYNTDRTATIVVTERNFNSEDVVYAITNTDRAIPSLVGWKTVANADPDKTTHTATVNYSADGDYTFDIKYSDRAKNAAALVAQQKFTLDKTDPVINVTYNNNSSVNGNYFNASRTATISITEHNFEPSRIRITGSATDDGNGSAFPNTSAWTANGDVHTATISYSTDGLYSFDIDYTDMAGNQLADYATEEFYVDQTAPTLTITGVEDMSANNGDVIPVVSYSDTNFNRDSVSIELTGANRKSVKLDGSNTDVTNGQTFTFNNFEEIKENDDLYTLTATIVDFAGNETKQTIRFSVNRFGSVYTFDESLKNIDGKYVQKEIDVILTETNVDSLKKEMINVKMSKNGKPIDLVEGADYTVSESGGEGSWSQYTYVINKELFTGDGRYTVTLYSEDAAGNINETIDETKEAEVAFGIDKTAPVVVPIDIENGEQYPVENKNVTVSIKDNLVLENAAIFVNEKEVEYEVDGENYVFNIPSSNSKQMVKIVAVDAAGNELTTDVKDLLVTTNIFARWYNNTALFIGSIAGVAGIGISGASYYVFRRNKIPVDVASKEDISA